MIGADETSIVVVAIPAGVAIALISVLAYWVRRKEKQ